MGYRTEKKKNSSVIIYIGVGILFICLLCSSALYAHLTVENITIKISDKERIVTGSGDSLSSKFLVYCDGEVLENSDSLWHWKFNSSDIQGELKKDKTYYAKVYGWRVPFLSWYRNIVKIELKED
jgi:hypothetical protein